MKITINRRVYDTDNAELLGGTAHGFFGQTDGYEEKIFRTRQCSYFIYGVGGENSKYPEASILPMQAADAKAWMAEHGIGE